MGLNRKKGKEKGRRQDSEREEKASIMEEFIVTLKLNTQKKWGATSAPLLVMNFSPEGDNVLKQQRQQVTMNISFI